MLRIAKQMHDYESYDKNNQIKRTPFRIQIAAYFDIYNIVAAVMMPAI